MPNTKVAGPAKTSPAKKPAKPTAAKTAERTARSAATKSATSAKSAGAATSATKPTTSKATKSTTVATRAPATKATATATRATASNATTSKATAKKPAAKAPSKTAPASAGQPGRISREQALANTRGLLDAKREQHRHSQSWQSIGPAPAHPGSEGFQSPGAIDKAEELHAGESRMSAIEGSISTRGRQSQGKRDHR